MNEKDKIFTQLIGEVSYKLTELISYSSTTSAIEALKHQGIELTKEQKK